MGKHNVTITSAKRLSNSGFHRSGGSGSGAAHWWLRVKDGDFVKLPRRVRGDAKAWTLEVELHEGDYVLGVGRGRDAIRQDWTVTSEGEWV